MHSLSLPRRLWLGIALSCAVVTPAWAAPGQPTLVSPAGELTGSTMVFSWNAVPASEWYVLWVGSTVQAELQQWYSAEQAGCASGGTCSANLTLGLAPGPYFWFVAAYNSTGLGPWSASKAFSVKDPTPTWSRKLSNDRRFTLVFSGLAVLDNETGLVWERTPSAANTDFANLGYQCNLVSLDGRRGWRAPSVAELISVSEPGTIPGGPTGPFSLGSPSTFWTVTDYGANALIVDVSSGAFILQEPKGNLRRRWCVRGNGSERVE